MKKEIKKGTIKKSNTELFLLAGSKITTVEHTGEIIEYTLGSDTYVTLKHEAKLFQVK